MGSTKGASIGIQSKAKIIMCNRIIENANTDFDNVDATILLVSKLMNIESKYLMEEVLTLQLNFVFGAVKNFQYQKRYLV